MIEESALEHDASDQSIKYLDNLRHRNPSLIEVAAELHQKNLIPVSTYVLDLDAHITNAKLMMEEARKHGVSLYYMSKQIARNPIVVGAVLNTGFSGIVAVEPQELRSLVRYGVKVGNVGHLANVPENEIDYVLRVARPEVITVFNYEKAKMVSDRVEKLGLEKQKLLVRPTGKDDVQYAYMEGGPPEERALEEIVRINALPNVRVAGVTSFPCMLFDLEYAEPTFTPNMATLLRVAERARNKGIELPMINSPPLTTTATIPLYAAKGSTHLEPGQGVSGMSIYQVLAPERHREVPAVVHVTEVSHFFGEHAYVYGGGFGYIELYELSRGGKNYVPDLARAKLRALVGREPKALNPVDAVPYRGMIDYHAKIARVPGVRVGDTAVFAFRTQMFVTRAQVAVVAGLSENATKLVGLFDQAQNLIDRHGHLQGERATMDLIEKYSHSDLA